MTTRLRTSFLHSHLWSAGSSCFALQSNSSLIVVRALPPLTKLPGFYLDGYHPTLTNTRETPIPPPALCVSFASLCGPGICPLRAPTDVLVLLCNCTAETHCLACASSRYPAVLSSKYHLPASSHVLPYFSRHLIVFSGISVLASRQHLHHPFLNLSGMSLHHLVDAVRLATNHRAKPPLGHSP